MRPRPCAPLTISDFSFTLVSFRGNAVLRWEYLPGSTLYIVWTQSRSEDEPWSDPPFNHSLHRMLDAHPDNIFLVKLAYWLGM